MLSFMVYLQVRSLEYKNRFSCNAFTNKNFNYDTGIA